MALGVQPRGIAEVDFFHLAVGTQGTLALGCWPHDAGLVFALADGVAGEAGTVASRLALDALADGLAQAPPSWPVKLRLRRALQNANVALYERRVTVPDLRAMATALTATAVVGGTLVTVHVGDCRLLLLRDGRLSQLTKEHAGEAAGPTGAVPRTTRPLSRALARELIVSVDTISLRLAPGDVLCQCTRPLHEALGDAEVAELLTAHMPPAACRALLRRGGEEGAAGLGVQVAAVVSCPPGAGRGRWMFW